MEQSYSIRPRIEVSDTQVLQSAGRVFANYGIAIKPVNIKLSTLHQGIDRIGWATRDPSMWFNVNIFEGYVGDRTKEMLGKIGQTFMTDGIYRDPTPKKPRPEDTRIEVYHNGRKVDAGDLTVPEIIKLTRASKKAKE